MTRNRWLIGATVAVALAACTGDDADSSTTTQPAVTRSSGGLTAVDDETFALQGEPAFIDVLANDTSGDPLSITIVEVTQPDQGEANISFLDGKAIIDFVAPFEGEWEQSTFTYTAEGNEGRASAIVTVRKPEGELAAIDDFVTLDVGNGGNGFPVQVMENDIGRHRNEARMVETSTDLFDDGGFRFGRLQSRSGGEVSIEIEPDPQASIPTRFSFDYEIENDLGARSSATVTVTFEGIPKAVDDVVAINEGFEVAIDVLANDEWTGGDPSRLEIVEVTEPIQGEVDITGERIQYRSPPDGSLENDPEPQVTFTYTVESPDRGGGGLSFTDTATVTVFVNRAPVAVDDTFLVNEGQTEEVTLDVLANDSDPDGDTLEVIDVRGPDVVVDNGVVRLRPNPNSVNYDFEYGVADTGVPGGSRLVSTARAMVTVNQIEPSPDSYRLEAGSTTVLPVTETDFDPEGDAFEITAISDPSATVDEGGIAYTVPTDACTTSFEYTVTDARGAFDTTQVFIDILGGQVPPTIAVPTLRISDNAPPGTRIGELIAGGGCGGTGDRTYRILEGNDDGAFAFDPLSAVLSVGDPSQLDADVASERVLVVEFTDAVFTVTRQVTVTITSGSAPVLFGTATDEGFWVQPEDGQLFCLQAQEPGSADNRAGFATATSAGFVTATDVDGDQLTYSLSNLNPEVVQRGVATAVASGAASQPPSSELSSAPIEIDPTTGEIRRNGSGEFLFWAYRTRAPFTYQVSVTDGVSTVSGTLVIVVSEAC